MKWKLELIQLSWSTSQWPVDLKPITHKQQADLSHHFLIFLSPLSLQRTKRNSAAQSLTSVSMCVIRRTSLFLRALPTSGLFLTSRSGGNTCTHTMTWISITHQLSLVLTVHVFTPPALTFDLRNFLVSLWMRALSVNKFSDGRSVSFSLCPCDRHKHIHI